MAQLKPFIGKEKIGHVTLERFKDYLRLHWTLQGKSYVISLGRDSTDTLKTGRAKAQSIDADITFERFDLTLRKYGKSQPVVLELLPPQQQEKISLRALWDNFLVDKLPNLKPKTQVEYNLSHTFVEHDPLL